MSVAERYTGRVKWFNNKAGYGFITVTDGSKAGSDIFVHHSSIQIDTEQYKYLVQGEYVEFCLSAVSSGDHEFQAGDVSGIKGGKLMCQTRHEMRTVRTQHKETQGGNDGGTWTHVSQPKTPPRNTEPTATPNAPVKLMRRTSAPTGGRGAPTRGGRGAARGGRGGRL
jgi:CspA family cold shock protein